MQPIDAAAAIGELISWVCLVPGIPMLLAAWLLRARDGDWSPVDLAILRRGGATVARWYAGGDFHERSLSAGERRSLAVDGGGSEREDDRPGFVSDRRPSRMRLVAHAPASRLLLVIAAVLTIAGAIGFVLSLLPLLS